MGIVLGLFLFLCFYFGMPTIKYGFIGLPIILFFSGLIVMLFDLSNEEFEGTWKLKVGLGTMIISFVFIVIFPIGSMALWRSDEYRDQIGKIEEKTFTPELSPTNLNDIIIIDYEVAARLADKKLTSENSSLGSQVSIGRFTLVKVKDKLFYVAPLNHTDYWKWRKNKGGTPGYMIVNANNDNDVRLVTKVNDKTIYLKYQDNAYFSSNLQRHIYKNGYRTIGRYDAEFELDDDMMPWYIIPIYDKKIGYSGKDVVGVLIVNPETGEIKEYDLNNVPEWVDRVHPKEFVSNQINNWGDYVHGVFNWSGLDKKQLTDGVQVVYGSDDICYYYSGLTSTGTDDASMGFVMTNTRTKQTTFYKSSGATEYSAQNSAMQKVSEKGYVASFPRPYSINGVWTYVMALKDSEGLIKMIALVSYEQYQIVGVGDNIMDASRNFKSALNSNGNVIVPSATSKIINIIGKVKRINSVYNNNNNYFYLILDNFDSKLYVVTTNISNEILLTQVGDMVNMSVDNANDTEIFVTYFDNTNLNFYKSEEQKNIEQSDSLVDVRVKTEKLDTKVKSKLENMTDEEKQKFVEN